MFNESLKHDNVYNLLINEIKSNRISHAYLIDENNNRLSYDFVLSFIKEILCLNVNEEEKSIICKRIDDGNYPELKVIKPDGLLIKKQQILDLQKEFSMSAFEGKKRIYIIRDCEKMRPETANSMLKFLEEPESDIVAFLMTNNINNILPTIVSRCQIIRLGNDVVNDDDSEFDELVFNFVNNIESIGKKTILYENKLIFNEIGLKNRELLVKFFDKLVDIYYDIMKIIISMKKDVSIRNYDKLVKYCDNNDINKILNKISYIVDAKDAIMYNVNCNLLVDSLILNIGG